MPETTTCTKHTAQHARCGGPRPVRHRSQQAVNGRRTPDIEPACPQRRCFLFHQLSSAHTKQTQSKPYPDSGMVGPECGQCAQACDVRRGSCAGGLRDRHTCRCPERACPERLLGAVRSKCSLGGKYKYTVRKY